MQLEGCVAVLTGAGRKRSVGAATARLLAKRGCHILINCLKSEEQATSVVEACRKEGVDAQLFLGDLTNATTCQHLAHLVEQQWGRLDILVNCMGITKSVSYEKLEALNADDFARLFSVNVTAPFLVTQALAPLLRASKSAALVNISSAAGISGKGSSIAYAAVKGAENTLTLALAQALSPDVRVNAVCPSFVDSSWWEETYAGRDEQYQGLIKKMCESNLLGRVLKPEDVASAILAIIENPSITGELIRLDAGAHVGIANPK